MGTMKMYNQRGSLTLGFNKPIEVITPSKSIPIFNLTPPKTLKAYLNFTEKSSLDLKLQLFPLFLLISWDFSFKVMLKF